MKIYLKLFIYCKIQTKIYILQNPKNALVITNFMVHHDVLENEKAGFCLCQDKIKSKNKQEITA